MKKLLPLILCAASVSAYALPTYEPFTEFGPTLVSSPTTLVVMSNSVSLGTNANAGITNCLNLASGGYTAPGGETWTKLNFSGTAGAGGNAGFLRGLDIAVISNSTAFPEAMLSSLLPPTFPGYPPAGTYITNMLENPAQPLIWWPAANKFVPTNYVGNSAVLTLAQDITRPTSGTRTVYISYLLNIAQQGQLGAGNEGRYLAFVSSTNLLEGTNLGPTVVAYTNWAAMFNAFNSNSPSGPRYASHGILQKTANSTYYLGACDSGKGLNWSTTPLSGSFNAPVFVVGAYVLNSGANADTNIMWANPAPSTFGGAAPPTSGNHVWPMTNFNMSDLGGVVFIDRLGNAGVGGVGTNYVANLIVGSTWSYVTGGPEFNNPPPATTTIALGGSGSITGGAVAAGQTVNYQWVKITGGVTNNVNNGPGGAGGGANVSGATAATLSLTGISAGDAGNYQLVATASSTGYLLNSTTAAVILPDPLITSSPPNATVNYGHTATLTATATTGNAPLHYGWYLNGQPLQNGTLPGGSQTTAVNATGTTAGSSPFTITLTLNNADYLAAGSYYLVVTNSISLQASSLPASLGVNDPYIVTQPVNPVVTPGNNATFTVVAAGSPTPSTTNYQWFEGTPPGGTSLSDGGTTVGGSATVSGSQTPTLTLTGVQDADNSSYYCQISGSASGQTVNSTAAVLIVQDPLTIFSPPMSLVERAGDHAAFSVGVTGGGAIYQWYAPGGGAIAGATTSALVLTNIQTGSNGTYRVAVGNASTAFQNFNPTLTVINNTVLNLSSANLVVARVGDGAQTLSGATGNTLYLDQYTTTGTYVNTAQLPDEATGQPYGTGSANSIGTSPSLLVAGAGSDAAYEAMLTLSPNQEYLGFAGYCQAYPFAGADVTVGSGTLPNPFVRGLATMNAFGVYTLAYTNSGFYSGGNHTIRSMVTLDQTNFWTTGQAGSGTVKFGNGSSGTAYANGSGVPSSSGVSGAGGRSIQVVSGALPGFSSGPNLVVADAGQPGNANNGLWAASGAQEPAANGSIVFSALLFTGAGQPGDFAFSPDNQTIYVADSRQFTSTSDTGGGGIQRWDSNGSGYDYSYTLPALPGGTATNGAQGLTVDFSATGTWGAGVTGAKIYATATGASGNSLVQIVDTGSASTPTVLATAGPSQALRGVRFGPAAIAPAITSAPQTNTVPLGNSTTFSAAAAGSAPLFYQWYAGGTRLAGATQSTFTTNNLAFASAGNYILVVSNLTTQTASVTNVLFVTAGAPAITPTPLTSYVETVGDHLAWGPTVTGTQPITNYWYYGSTLVQSNVTPGANGSLALTNIQTTNDGTYTLVVSNFYGHASASGVLTVTTTHQTLSSANLVVARIGDGAQTLSGATGNTLYLDQFTAAGGYVNTIQIPDEGTGQPYGAGSSTSSGLPSGSPALLFAGAGPDAPYEAALTLAPNQETLAFAGYCQAYPFAGADVTVSAGNGGNQWRGVATVNAYGYYALSWTNSGLYSGGNHTVRAAFDIDGNGRNFYTAGQSGGGNGIKYCDPANELCPGTCIPGVAGSFPGTRVVQVVAGNLVFSDAGPGVITNGIYAALGLPTTPVSSAVMIAETNSPMDFAVSPDLNTVYIADNGAFAGTSSPVGGIQRWDANGTSGFGYPTYAYSYTLGTGTGSAAGARGLTVDFSAAGTWGSGVTGAKIYATTAEASGNRLIKITDTGASSAATLISTAGIGQILAGVRFGPTAVAPGIATEPDPVSALAGSTATFTASATGSGPLTYQWYFQAGCAGAFHAINLATNATYTIASAGIGNAGCYYVVVSNPVGQTATSSTVTLTLLARPVFTSEVNLGPGNGIQLNFTGPAGFGYTIWTSTDVALGPIESTWTTLTTGAFSGGDDTYTDSSGGANPQQFYIISVP